MIVKTFDEAAARGIYRGNSLKTIVEDRWADDLRKETYRWAGISHAAREFRSTPSVESRGWQPHGLAGSLLSKRLMNIGTSFELELPRSAHTNGASTIRTSASRRGASRRLGDILIDEGLATAAEVQQALHLQSAARVYQP